MRKIYDVAVVGGGVVGGAILRELTKYHGSFCLLEKEDDVAMGQSKANSGIVHAGFDAVPGSNKAKFNVLGNQMMWDYARDLGVKCIQNGAVVMGYEGDEEAINALYERGKENGVPHLKICNRDELLSLEPNIGDEVICGLLAPTSGIVCPYELTVASIGNAMDNGAQLFCNFEVVSIEKEGGVFALTSAKGDTVSAKVIINSAAFFSDKIARMAGDSSFQTGGRRGEYILLDRESGGFVTHTLFTAPTKAGKGVLVSPTVDGNIILGPTAEETSSPTAETTAQGLEKIKTMAKRMCKNIPYYNTITSFCGVRAYCDRHDFIIEKSAAVENLINLAGIESPGLTSSPAIAKYVVEELVGSILPLERNERFNGVRTPDYFFKTLTSEQKNELIKKDKRYGKIICRCEQVTEGEIARVIRENPPAKSVDAVKRRTRAGMGRCQGGFCQVHVAEIIARELNIPMEEVTKKGEGSKLLIGRTK